MGCPQSILAPASHRTAPVEPVLQLVTVRDIERDVTHSPPAKDVTHSPPAKDVTHSPSAKDVTHSPPAKDVTHSPSAKDVTYSPPAKDVTHSPPAPPAKDVTHSPPAPPAKDVTHSPPAKGLTHSPPAKDVTYSPPAKDVTYSPPTKDVNHSPPALSASHLKPCPSKDKASDEIAIVGIGCRTPGADNLQDYWRVLVNGECHVGDVPASRWRGSAFLDPDPMAYRKAKVQKGAFISDIDGFDNGLYGISDFEARSMDRQQCFMLDCTMMALEDSGITRAQIAGTNTGVFVGSMHSDDSASFVGVTSKVDGYTATGASTSIVANRVSHVFDLKGPSLVLDSACSASMVAVHLGCQSLVTGDCDTAICGGVCIMTLPDLFVHLSKAGMISPTGKCHTFSDKADGYTRGEGCGVLILKRLDDALRDGNKVWATISTCTNQNGRAEKLLTTPSNEQQKKLLSSTYSKFNINVDEVEYIEAHGTGTPAGDPVETNALGSFFKQHGTAPKERYIGSVKTNIGHTEAAAGILSIIKVLLMMKHNKIVPSLHCETVNPKINLADLYLAIPRQAIPWETPNKVAGCNSFGFGGTNAHAVLKHTTTLTNKTESTTTKRRKYHIICFSNKTSKGLKGSMQEMLTDDETSRLDVRDVSFTSTVRRDHYPHRAAFVVDDLRDLNAKIETRLREVRDSHSAKTDTEVAFVFCGMVPLWKGMCEELLRDFPVFANTMRDIETQLSMLGVPWSLRERLSDEDPSKDAVLAPLAIFAIQVCLAKLWLSLGVQAGSIVGQSLGEIAAAYTAGCLELADAVKIVYERSRLLDTVKGGVMFLFQDVEVEKIRRILRAMKGKASIALEYSPKACAVSVDEETEAEFQQEFRARQIPFRSLDLPVAYHSCHVDPCLEPLKKSIQDISSKPPQIRLISTVTGSVLKTPPDAQHWVNNMRNPVLFGKAINNTRKEDESAGTVFLEIGPRPVLERHLRDIFPNELSNVSCVPSVPGPKESDVKTFLSAVTALYEHNVNIEFAGIFVETSEPTHIPRYMFNRKAQRITTETDLIIRGGNAVFESSHRYVRPVQGSETRFDAFITPVAMPSLYDHVISGKVIVPGAYYVEAALALAHYRDVGFPVAVAADFIQPVSVEKNEVTSFQTDLTPCSNNSDRYEINIQRNGRKVSTLWIQRDQGSAHEDVNLEYIRSTCTDVVKKSNIYAALRRSGFEYGKSYSLLEDAVTNTLECLTELKVNETVCHEMRSTHIHPAILDGMLQSSWVIMVKRMQEVVNVLPKSVGRLVVYRKMEPIMYVHTRVKNQDEHGFSFDQLLLSPSGHVIAELNDMVIKVLSPPMDNSLPDLITEDWTQIREWHQLNTASGEDLIIICDSKKMRGETNSKSYLFEDLLGLPDLETNIVEALSSNENTTGVCLVFCENIEEGLDGGALQSRIVSAYCLIQTILRVLNEKKPDIHVYVCTAGAWPSPKQPHLQRQDVNPTATSLWGLMRTVVTERVYPHITMVELQFAQAELTLGTLRTQLGSVNGDADLPVYTEIMLTTEAVLVNHIYRVPKNILIPRHRAKQRTVTGDRLPPETMILSKDAESISDPVAVAHCKNSVKVHNTEVKHLQLKGFVQPSKELVTLTVASNGHGSVLTHNFAVTALELEGRTVDSPETEIISCCPSTVGAEVTVPADTALAKKQIPDYRPGDLTSLVLLWQLYKQIETKTATVMASQSTLNLADSFKLLSSDKQIDICLLDDPNTLTEVRETVVSLNLIDSNIISSLSKHWDQAKCLVVPSSLLTPTARSTLTCTSPEVQLCLLDTHLLFQTPRLIQVIPELKAWIENNQSKMSILLEALRRNNSRSNIKDMSHLLRFEHQEMAQLSVTFMEDQLFRKDSCYIVVGGLTGLGWMCVEFLAENNAGHIAIINRSAPSEERKGDITNIAHAHQCSVKAFQADITAPESLTTTLHYIREAFQCELRGVFTGAAVLDDAAFSDMKRETFEKVMSPKVLGTWNLHKHTMAMPLDYFVMHSSVTSVLGNPGQANYSAANAFLDGLAFHRRQLGLEAQTINWGPLDTGMLENKPQIKEMLVSSGFNIATEKEIRKNLKTLLLLNWPQSVPVTVDFDCLARKLYRTSRTAGMLKLKKVVSEKKPTHPLSIDSTANASTLQFSKGEERLEVYENYVANLISQILPDQSNIVRDQDLFELGLTSIDRTEMINQISRDTAITLAQVDVFAGGVTVTSLATSLRQRAREAN